MCAKHHFLNAKVGGRIETDENKECKFNNDKYTGWGQCIGTANRGYCKAGVKGAWKWY